MTIQHPMVTMTNYNAGNGVSDCVRNGGGADGVHSDGNSDNE